MQPKKERTNLLEKANASVIDRDVEATSELNEIVLGTNGNVIQPAVATAGLILIGFGLIIIGSAIL